MFLIMIGLTKLLWQIMGKFYKDIKQIMGKFYKDGLGQI